MSLHPHPVHPPPSHQPLHPPQHLVARPPCIGAPPASPLRPVRLRSRSCLYAYQCMTGCRYFLPHGPSHTWAGDLGECARDFWTAATGWTAATCHVAELLRICDRHMPRRRAPVHVRPPPPACRFRLVLRLSILLSPLCGVRPTPPSLGEVRPTPPPRQVRPTPPPRQARWPGPL